MDSQAEWSRQIEARLAVIAMSDFHSSPFMPNEPLDDEVRAEVWGRVAAIQQLLNNHGFGLNDNTALALRVITYLAEVPMEKRGGIDIDIDVLISLAYAEQLHLRKVQ